MLQYPAESVSHSNILEFFEQQAHCRPHNVAVETRTGKITYAELNLRASRIAAGLWQAGIGRGDLVAIYLDRSIDLIASVLGVLKSGAAYLPIDPLVPEQRVDYMLDDSGCALAITQPDLLHKLGNHRGILVEDLVESAPAIGGPASEPEPDDLAYVIYTSGSTGRPKGVEIVHRGLAACLDSLRRELELGPEDTLLAVTSPSFDVSVMEIFVALSSGVRIVIVPASHVMQSDLMIEALDRYQPTIIFGTPALWRLLIESGWKGNRRLRAITGGESLESGLAARLAPLTGALWNHYGPTETTIAATTCRVKPHDIPIPIGYALPHIRTFVVDPEGKIVEPGQPGELLIGGESLARGYRNHPELTAARFVRFESEPGVEEQVYRTGDLVRQRPDGAFEFIGRIDNQVKIRGFRIELEEIEAVLNGHPDVAEAIVVAHEDSFREKSLIGYYRAKPGKAPGVEALRSFLSRGLPAYMVPSHFVKLERFPLTVNGKIDRVELGGRELNIEERPAAPEVDSDDPVVVQLSDIWRRVLKLPSIGLDDNFFEIGGHSILAARLFTEISQRLHKNLPLSTLFEAPTIASLARVVASTEDAAWSPLVQIRNGTGTPFFCVHPIGGNVLTFKTLSQNMKSRPFYGLQARGLNGQESAHTSIEEMAADYLTYVRMVQPEGPYFLGGYSAGGLVAFEMTRLLLKAGQQVELLVLFDSYLHVNSLPEAIPGTYPSGLRRPVSAIGRRITQMRQFRKEQRIAVFARDIARVWATLKLKLYDKSKQWGLRSIRLDPVSAFLFGLRNYRPKPLDAKVMLFLADENAPLSAANLPAIWQKLVTGNLEVKHLAIDHDRMLDAPFAALLAAEIEDRIVEQHLSVN